LARESEILTDWYRTGRVPKERVFGLLKHPVRFWLQRYLILGFLPASWHRFLAEPRFAWTSIKITVGYPIKFYRDREFREEWLRETVAAGYEEGMLSDEERDRILAHIQDPFIQKYLKCVAVHLCTLPVTQVVSVAVAIGYMYWNEKPWTESWAKAVAILILFQGLPISPGSICRGSYVVYLMIRERNLRDYWVAGIVSFWHYVGYLGFPLQMVTKFPGLSRYLAGRWATGMVRIMPVFGEKGALAEHYVFDAFFNVPLSLWRMIRRTPETPR
jgi:hypothetical protein